MKSTAYLIQAVLISLWWFGLEYSEVFFEAFQFPEFSKKSFQSFFLPDIMLLVLLSLVRAYRYIKPLEWVILGAFAYGSLFCINASILSNGGFLATTLMLLGLGYNLFLVFSDRLFSTARSKHKGINAIKTIVQITCFWSISLIVFPYLIVEAFGIETASNQLFIYASYALFGLGSLLGLLSAYTIVFYGEGTPLPTDQTNVLVVNGPYMFIRNPMALAGMLQGFAVAMYFLSIHLVVYTLLGGILWHVVVRPLEERNMLERFGDEYKKYKSKVALWVPKL